MRNGGKKKPGGHQLSWDGDPYGVFSCARCTRKWQHKNNKIWKAQIWQRCTRNGEAEEQKRSELRKELEEWQRDQPASGNPHQLELEDATDLVMCRTRYLGSERCAGAAELGRSPGESIPGGGGAPAELERSPGGGGAGECSGRRWGAYTR